ncbi:hypothetical protein ACP4OV_005997 [Aristida adscensionis]
MADDGAAVEFEIRTFHSFVFKRPLRPDAPDPEAPSLAAAAAAAGPAAEAARRKRKRRALLRLREQYRRELAEWEALERGALALRSPPPPSPPEAEAAPASPHPDAAASFWSSVLDEHLAKAEGEEKFLKRVETMCHEINALCDAHEESVTDAITALPIWRDPRELMSALSTPDEQTSPGTSNNQDGESGGLQRPDSQQGRAIEAGAYDRCKETAGSSSKALERIKNCSEDPESVSYQCKRCSKFGHTENTCPDKRAGRLDPPPVLSETRKRKELASPTYSYSVAGQALNSSKRRKAQGVYPLPPDSRGPTRRRAGASTPTRA